MVQKPVSQDASPYRSMWQLDGDLAFLNHGSFGACPQCVVQYQRDLIDLAERDPVDFFNRHRQPLLDEARQLLAETVGTKPAHLVFDTNATHAINAVLRWLRFESGDEIVITSHGYNGINNAARYVADQTGAQVRVADIPVPIRSGDDIVRGILGAVTPNTRLAIVDHISSPTAVVFPLEQIIPQLRERGVLTLVDGAHGPGAIPVDLDALRPDFYAANCHKWLCSPRGAAFLYAAPHQRQRDFAPSELQPSSVSHGYNTEGPQQNRFHDAFDFPGTTDPTAWLSVTRAIRFVQELRGGLENHMQCNRQLAREGAELLMERCGLRSVCPFDMNGPMVTLMLPDDRQPSDLDRTTSPSASLMLHTQIRRSFGVQVPVFHFPRPPKRMLRISAQAYNCLDDYRRLADALVALL